ncbi:hypothetical protein F2Q68_00012392 [Brassica cretica]|uniref:Uncharacterized protein n=1 Tax=Brassica cretica TaxID=69181 RepID=A0A8S9KRB2_BRACR|nr:hypothetical protein F2Q68_00012393 [Brassica cretica]KAF2597910.1 hypothetical protein F2Q68_00012392 [Brassica cretica]
MVGANVQKDMVGDGCKTKAFNLYAQNGLEEDKKELIEEQEKMHFEEMLDHCTGKEED